VTEIGSGHTVRCYHPIEDSLSVPAGNLADVRRSHDAVLEVSAVSASYETAEVVHDVSLTLSRQQCLALVGESGSGKTTLARCVVGLHPSFRGTIRLHGQTLAASARNRTKGQRQAIQYVFQSPYASLNPRHTIADSISMPIRLFDEGHGTRERVAELLELVALPKSIARAYPDQLSGGERQRVAIARALAASPAVLVCDEITSALDVSVQAAIVNLLASLREQIGLSLLFITHNLALVRSIAEDVLVLHAGSAVESGETEAVLAAPAADYTRGLLADTPSFGLVSAAKR